MRGAHWDRSSVSSGIQDGPVTRKLVVWSRLGKGKPPLSMPHIMELPEAPQGWSGVSTVEG